MSLIKWKKSAIARPYKLYGPPMRHFLPPPTNFDPALYEVDLHTLYRLVQDHYCMFTTSSLSSITLYNFLSAAYLLVQPIRSHSRSASAAHG